MPPCFPGPANLGTGNAKIPRGKVFLTSAELGRMTNLLASLSVFLVWKSTQALGWDHSTHPNALDFVGLLTIVKLMHTRM